MCSFKQVPIQSQCTYNFPVSAVFLLMGPLHSFILLYRQSFRDGKVRCLVATDVAARGLDIPEVDLVVLTEPPKVGFKKIPHLLYFIES